MSNAEKLNKLLTQYTQVPSKQVKKLVKSMIDENTMLRKDNRKQRNKLKKQRKEIARLRGDVDHE